MIYRFQSVTEALLAISKDGLANVTYTAKEVHVFSTHGTGSFSKDEWEAARGPKNSQVSKKVSE